MTGACKWFTRRSFDDVNRVLGDGAILYCSEESTGMLLVFILAGVSGLYTVLEWDIPGECSPAALRTRPVVGIPEL